MKVKLADVCTCESSNLKQSDVINISGKYPVYGATGKIGYVDTYKQEKPYIAIVKDGAGIGRTHLCDSKSSVIGTLQYILPKDNVLPEYLFYVIKHMHLEKYYSGATIPHIYFKNYKNEEFNLDSINKQETIINILNDCNKLIKLKETQLQKYDDLIKARFVEMFGDPIINSFRIETKPMTDVCEIIDGDRGKNYPTADEFFDEEYCLFLNAKNVTSTGFNFDTCMFVTKEKDEALRKGKLSRGDIVLTTRGTLGNLAFYTKAVPFEHVRINSGMVILRMKQDIVDEMYFIEQFKMQLADIREKIASGSAQPQLPISTMNKINILIPNIEKQRQFADFVRQIDKSKLAVQKSLEKTQQLFDSLMQEYFG